MHKQFHNNKVLNGEKQKKNEREMQRAREREMQRAREKEKNTFAKYQQNHLKFQYLIICYLNAIIQIHKRIFVYCEMKKCFHFGFSQAEIRILSVCRIHLLCFVVWRCVAFCFDNFLIIVKKFINRLNRHIFLYLSVSVA